MRTIKEIKKDWIKEYEESIIYKKDTKYKG